MKMSQFNFFFIKYVVCIKSSNIEENAGRSASDLNQWMHNILLVNFFYMKYFVTIKNFPYEQLSAINNNILHDIVRCINRQYRSRFMYMA